MATDDLSPAELAFRRLLSNPAAYALWAAGVRRAWELENVVFFHGFRDGKPIWSRDRAPVEHWIKDPNERAPQRFQRLPNPNRETP